MADLLAASDLNEEQQWCLTTLRVSIDALSGLMGDILDMAALEAGTLAIDESPFELTPFMTKQLAPFAHCAEAKGLRFDLKIHDKVPARVRCYDKRFGQLLDKILSNAVKYTDAGEIVVEMDRARSPSLRPRSDLNQTKCTWRGIYLFVTVRVRASALRRKTERSSTALPRLTDTNRCMSAGLGLAIASDWSN
jgi:signal transduction histidine kinase